MVRSTSETRLAFSRTTSASIFLALFLLHACPMYIKFEDHPLEKPWIEEEQCEMKTSIKYNKIAVIFWFLGFHSGKKGRKYKLK